MSEYRDLYYRWEREQWEAGAIDLSPDATAWRGFTAEQKDGVLRCVAMLLSASERMTLSLVPLVDAVPGEEQQVFLTTQLADIARHNVFYTRVHEEVCEGMVRPELDPRFAPLLERITGVTALPEAIRVHNVDIETLLTAVLGELAKFEALPGVRAGVDRVLNDRRRHAEFGRLFLEEHAGGGVPA